MIHGACTDCGENYSCHDVVNHFGGAYQLRVDGYPRGPFCYLCARQGGFVAFAPIVTVPDFVCTRCNYNNLGTSASRWNEFWLNNATARLRDWPLDYSTQGVIAYGSVFGRGRQSDPILHFQRLRRWRFENGSQEISLCLPMEGSSPRLLQRNGEEPPAVPRRKPLASGQLACGCNNCERI